MADWTSSVRSYLRSQLLTITGLPAVAYEGRPYTPVVGTSWIREQLFPIDAPIETWGSDGYVRESFHYRLTLFSPIGGRLTDHENMLDTIRALFHPGGEIRDAQSRYSGTVVEARRGMNITEPDWISATVTIDGYIHRATRAA